VNVLIDGGPYQTFDKHLKPTLQKLPLNGKLDLIVLSHIDNDHIIGLIDLLEELKSEREKGEKELIKVGKLWHNSFNDIFELVAEPNTLLKNSFLSENFRSTEHTKKRKNIFSSLIMKGFQQGTDLSQLAKSLKMKINPGFKKLIFVNETANSIRLKHLNFKILGPTKKNLDKLKEEWKDWLTKKRRNIKSEIGLFQLLDKSVPNLASIVFLVELKNRKILFTGDGIGDDILKVLSENTMLDNNGKFHVDILKVPHHGSDRNASTKFFDIVYANYYIISANGRDDNPSPDTLKWIIESNNNHKNPKKIIMTNMTPGIRKVLGKYDQKKFNYHCVFLEKNENFLTIKLQ
jgi:metal-dependent hydrolase (beta-lactamase superfamily II)